MFPTKVWAPGRCARNSAVTLRGVLATVPTYKNGSNMHEWFWDRVETWTKLWQQLYHMKNPNCWHLGQFPPQNQDFASRDTTLESCIWVPIVSWHDVYADCAATAALPPLAFRLVIWPIFVQSLSKIGEVSVKLTLIWQLLNEYQSDHKSECGSWVSC